MFICVVTLGVALNDNAFCYKKVDLLFQSVALTVSSVNMLHNTDYRYISPTQKI
jgi:hypothetical protein